MKSILRYPGGKTRAIKILFDYIPKNTKTIISPFFGGGSFEFFCYSQGCEIIANDFFKPLANFWNCLHDEKNEQIYQILMKNKNVDSDKFKTMQKLINSDLSDVEKASYFYIVNRCSFSGSTCSGGMSKGHPRFNQSSIDRIRNFKMPFSLFNLDFSEFLEKNEGFVFADPPYMISNYLYGNSGDVHKGFDHIGLAKILKTRGNFILTYNDSDEVRELYADYEIIPLSWAYGMNKTKKSSEILILGQDGIEAGE